MDDDKIRYEDLISPDDSIKTLIDQLTELNKTYGTVMEVVKTGARDIVTQLKSMSSATSEGRTEIDEATAAANRLARAQKELRFAMSDTGKEVAWLKSQVASQNKMSAEMQKSSASLIGSYDKLKSELREQIGLWKSLSEAERTGSFGQDLLNSILQAKQRLSDLDGQLKIHVQSLSAVEKAQQKLTFLRSAEGQELLSLKQQISDIIASSRTQKATLDEVAQAQERLRAAQSASRQEAHEYNILAKEANRVAKLQAQLNLSQEGSYNQLAAQYELNKIKLNAMSSAERQATDAGKQLEAETLELYVRMQKLQEATGNHRLSVGNYARSWDGLGISVSQVVRELPAAAVSMNTFFLGISNNIPILMDEIGKLRAENKKAVAEGKPTKSVIGSITKALFSWNTMLVIGLTMLSMHGKAIIEWVSSLFRGSKEAIKYQEALENVNKELEKTNGSFGQNMASLMNLQREWKNLRTEAEKVQWIRNNQSEFNKLDIAVRNVNEAENVLVTNTNAVVEAFRQRAIAAAAMKLAAEKYEEALREEMEAETTDYNYEYKNVKDPKTGKVTKQLVKTKRTDHSFWAWLRAGFLQSATTDPETGRTLIQSDKTLEQRAERMHELDVQRHRDNQKAAEKEGDIYIDIANRASQAAENTLKAAGVFERQYKINNRTTRNPRQRDLTDTIWRNDLSIRKKYELSLSELQRNEFEKRRIEAIDQANQTIREMQEKFRKNEDFLLNPKGKYAPLTEEQKKQIQEQQNEINAIIENTRRKLEIDLKNIDYEAEADRAKTLRQRMKYRLDTIAEEVEKEKQIRLQQLEEQERLYSTKGSVSEGGEVVVTGVMTPEELAKFHRERQKIIAEYDTIIYNMKARSIANYIELVKKGSEEELELLLRQNEIARKLALAENMSKPIEERQSELEIEAIFDKRGALIRGSNRLTNFDRRQAQAEAEFNIVKHSENQITIFKLNAERDRWKEMVKLAKEGALDWSDAQIKEAEAMIKKLEREINEASNFMNLISEKGLGGALLTKLGFDDDQIKALSDAVNIILDNIKSIVDAEVEAAEKAVEAAQKRVDAAQSAYDAEIEGRNNGYANNVATAKKELQLEKRNQAQKQKILEEAQRRQEAINTVTQASSLITASANLWRSFSSIPIIGPALAMAAIAAMWTSFAIAKVRAAQITKSSQEYGEGGLEFLEGGSHASGNDIDLQTRNSKGKNMRAEGGEAMAIINRRSTRKYRKMLPQLVDSINKGTFEDKFSQAFKTGEELSQNIVYQQQILDLSRIEDDIRALRYNSEQQYHIMPDGSYIEKKKNVLRRMH